MVNLINKNHFNDFNLQLISLVNAAPDEMFKNLNTIDKINKLLNEHCLELEDPNNQTAIRLLKERIVHICNTQFSGSQSSESLLLKVQLIGIGDRLSGNNINDFNLKLRVLAKKTSDETLKNPDIIDKIIKFLNDHPEEAVNPNNLTDIRLLKDRFYSFYNTLVNAQANEERATPLEMKLGELTTILMKIESQRYQDKNFINSLDAWLMEEEAQKTFRLQACILIMDAWINEYKVLILSELKLTSLPDAIGKLTQLERLHLEDNNITNLPESIKNLTKLNYLNLKNNQLIRLPDTIGQLTHLVDFYLGNNQLKSLPDTIGQLTHLVYFHLGNNQLTSLPDEIGQLMQLEELSCDENQLTSLPVTLGNLTNSLREIDLTDNSQLEELPLSMGQLQYLQNLYIHGTRIPEEQGEAILQACEELRNSSENLISHITLWLQIGKKKLDLPNFQEHLTDRQQLILRNWLIRLEKTKDFQHNQQQLAATVCDMLSTLTKDDEFKEFFFIQAEANNAACDDRASMSLNEIYTYWKICNLPENASTTEKLEIITSAAKTFTLRNAISQAIDEHQKEQGNVIEREAVEIYLYYETLLREKLGLLSAVQNMRYHEIGKRDWINEADLERSVESMYKNELVDQPAFKALIEQNESFTDPWGLIHSEYANKMNDLDNQKTSLKEGEYNAKGKALVIEKNEKWKETALEWFEQQLAPQSRKRSSSNSTEYENLDKKRKTSM